MSALRVKPLLCGLVTLALAAGGVVDERSATAARKRPCADLQLSYSLRTLEPGQVFDYSQAIVNCSNRTRTIRVRIRAFVPCEFPHPSSAKYRLPAGFGVQAEALMLAPPCSGHYRIVGKAIFRGSVVARAHAGFTVVPH
jgi:hypothetical protein